MPDVVILADGVHGGFDRLCSSIEGESIIVASRDVETHLQAAGAGLQTLFLFDIITRKDIEQIDKTALGLVRSTFREDDAGVFHYRGVPMGALLEFYFIPYFVRTLRDIFFINEVLRRYPGSRYIISGNGPFARASRLCLGQRGIGFESWFNGVFKRVRDSVAEFFRAKKKRWIGHPLSELFAEPVQHLVILVVSLLRRVFLRRPSLSGKSERLFCFSADSHLMPVYRKMRERSGWRPVCSGFYLAYVRQNLREVEMLEESCRVRHIAAALGAAVHSIGMFLARRYERALTPAFSFAGMDFSPLVLPYIRYNVLINLPRIYLIHEIAGSLFGEVERGVFAVFAEEPPPYRAMVEAARANGIKTLVVQHGVLVETNGHDRISVDAYAGWGEYAREHFKAACPDNDLSRISVTGSPRYDGLLETEGLDDAKFRDSHKIPLHRHIIAIFTEWAQDFTSGATAMQDLAMIESVLEAVRMQGLSGKCCVVVKPHPSGDIHLVESYIASIMHEDDCVRVVCGRPNELLSAATVCVSGYSTVLLEAIIFRRPVIVFDRYNGKEYVNYASSGAALEANTSEAMAEAISALLPGGGRRDEVLGNLDAFIRNKAYRIDNRASERVCRLVDKVVEGEPLPGFIDG